MWLVKNHRANFTAEQGVEISWRAHLSFTETSPPHARGSTRILNTEISWYGAPWSRLTLKCECKICVCKTQLPHWLITLNKDSHSKETFKEFFSKTSYFSHQPLTSCHIRGYFFAKSLILPGHFPWLRGVEWGCSWDKWPKYGRDGLDIYWYSTSPHCLIFGQWRESRMTFQHSVAWEYLERRDCWGKAVWWGNVDA